ncbi:MAG TPA: hypothetical protein VJ951_08620 [Bacteroidales bacterium]|nr:hypothetical protein [Bacteroidales bacterium]
MKAIIQIIAVLMTIHFGAVEAIAQSARKSAPENREKRVSTQRSNRSLNSSSKSKKSNAVHSQPRNRSNSHVKQSRSAKINNSKSTARVNEGNQSYKGKSINPSKRRTVHNDKNEKVSTTNRHNPRSTYKAPKHNSRVGKTYRNPRSSRSVSKSHNARTNGSYNSTTVSRRYYPAKKVQIHVHPKTYHGSYRVLYYPSHREIVWTRRMYRDYADLYPGYRWRYPIGYRINTISAFDARYNIGEVSRVYGRVYGTWYNRQTGDLLLFFGGEFPYQNFTMVVPKSVARKYSWRPEKFFLGQHVMATGLITSFEGKPEMIIKRRHQLDVY